MYKINLFFAILTFNLSYSQCDTEIEINYSDDTVAKYLGCLDDEGRPSGQGTLTHADWVQKGNFFNGKLNGKGSIFFIESNDLYVGHFEHDEIIEGKNTYKNNKIEITYTGKFKNFKFHGSSGELIKIQDEIAIKENGEFINGVLFNGYITKEYKSGLSLFETVKNGHVISEIRNDTNYYNSEDIIGEFESSEIKLIKEGDENEGISYKIPMKIDGVNGVWIFDTGAQSFTIGKRLFERLVEEGISYKELNMSIKSFGIGGESNGEYVILNNVEIGDYTLNNVVAKVSLDNNYSLLGIGLLRKFNNVIWNMNENSIELHR